MSDQTQLDAAPLPVLLEHSAASFEISTEAVDADALLAGNAARHFPEARDRRKEDAEAADIQRLRTILEALDKGLHYPDDAEEIAKADLHSQFYRQF